MLPVKPTQKVVEIVLQESDILKEFAHDIIDKEMLDLKGARVKYLMAYPHISKKCAGKCIKSTKELKYYSEADYIIEISNDLWSVLDENMKYVLMLNQLLKICPTVNEKTGSINYKVIDHDFKGFAKIIKKYGGMDWYYRMREINASLYDLSPSEAEGFSL
ncbi:MAG TPA: putative metallopeptidase [Ignavibacteriales bacterium]|jgi:hypothetical protein|nr:putative metallopeptidase [Ignavibacteriales bacterium]